MHVYIWVYFFEANKSWYTYTIYTKLHARSTRWQLQQDKFYISIHTYSIINERARKVGSRRSYTHHAQSPTIEITISNTHEKLKAARAVYSLYNLLIEDTDQKYINNTIITTYINPLRYFENILYIEQKRGKRRVSGVAHTPNYHNSLMFSREKKNHIW